MVVIPPGGVARVKVICQESQQTSYNILYIGNPSASVGNVLSSTLFPVLQTIFGVYMPPLLSSSAQYRGLGLQLVNPGPPGDVEYDGNIQSGTLGGNALPKQTAGLLRLYTSAPGSRHKGRIYIPFPSDAVNTGDAKPDGTYVTALGNLGTAILAGAVVTDTTGASVTMNFAVYAITLSAYYPVTSAVGQPSWATQRRRGDYGKLNNPPV